MSMREGWACPKCGRVWAPICMECTACNGRRSQKAPDPDAASLGRRGGAKGGKARAEALSPERRKEIASKAAKTRWEKLQ